MRPAVFTICSNRHVPEACVLLASVARFLPDAHRVLVLADTVHPGVPYPAACEIITADELGIPDFRNFAFRYARHELVAALKPFAFQWLLRLGRYDVCLYFDPDIEIFSPLEGVRDALSGGASFALTPHILSPSEANKGPDDVSFLRDGTYNLGFLGVGDTREAHGLLAWWARWLRWECVDDRPIGFYIDQKFIDLIPGFASDVRILHEPALNVAYWNLRQRAFVPASPEGPMVDGQPLGFFHYRGFDPAHPDRLSRETELFAGDDLPASWRDFLSSYAQRLLAAGHGSIPEAGYAYGRFTSGVPIPDIVRRMFRNDYEAWAGDPFDTFESWSHLPVRDAVLGIGSAIPSYMMQWLQARHPGLAGMNLGDPDGAKRLTRWWLDHGTAAGLDRRYLEPQALAAGERPIRLQSRRPPPQPHRTDASVFWSAADEGSPGASGYGVLAGLSPLFDRVEDIDIDAGATWKAGGRMTFLCIEPNRLGPFLRAARHRMPDSSYRIYVPSSELPDTSAAFRDALAEVDEIWAPTRFWQAELVLQAEIPVLHMPVLWRFPRRPPAVAPVSPGRPYILAEGDGFAGRGALLAALDAYAAAFAGRAASEWPALVIRRPESGAWHEPAQHAVSRAGDVILLDRSCTRADTDALVAGASCVLALHRGEALGVSVARALAFGVSIVATEYGGCTDLLTPHTGFPVDAHLCARSATDAGDGWESPRVQADEAHAAWSLREVFDNPAEARRRAANGMRVLDALSGAGGVLSRQAARLTALGLLSSSRVQGMNIGGVAHV